ncbi:MAG: EamA family transporter [Bacteroidota bacterium]
MWQDRLKLHFIVLLWGFTAILGDLISLNALEVVMYRTLIATIGTGLLIVWEQKQKKATKKKALLVPQTADGKPDLKRALQFMGIGVVIGLHWICFFGGVKVANVSVCLAGLATASLWTAIIDPLVRGKSIKGFEILLGVIVLIGLGVIFSIGIERDNFIWGLILGIAAAVLAAVFSTLNGIFTQDYHHYTITMYGMMGAFLTSTLGATTYALVSSEPQLWFPTLADWGWLFLLGGVCTVYAYSVSVELLQRISVFTMNLAVNLEPIYGFILAAILFEEYKDLRDTFYIGAFIVILAVALHPLIQRWEKKHKTSLL